MGLFSGWELPIATVATVSLVLAFCVGGYQCMRWRWLARVQRAEVVQGDVVEYV
tara:strand:+ start:128 stop:289 length:162 start_codon:yes stop_codon:yes gene_type:complete